MRRSLALTLGFFSFSPIAVLVLGVLGLMFPQAGPAAVVRALGVVFYLGFVVAGIWCLGHAIVHRRWGWVLGLLLLAWFGPLTYFVAKILPGLTEPSAAA